MQPSEQRATIKRLVATDNTAPMCALNEEQICVLIPGPAHAIWTTTHKLLLRMPTGQFA